MKVLWLTWKDIGHPRAGGAEIVCKELTKRLIANGHEVTLLTSKYEGANQHDTIGGVNIIRVKGNRYVHPISAFIYYFLHLRNKFDVVIEEVQGGAPYFASFFSRKSKRFLLYHQLARRNWLYEVPKPFSYLGYYILVPIVTRLVGLSRAPVITVSNSTKEDLLGFGFRADKVHIISEGIGIEPLGDLNKVGKDKTPTVLSHGGVRAMKRTIDQVQAFEKAKATIPNLKLNISGNSEGAYGKKVLEYVNNSPHKNDITYFGSITEAQKIKLMRKSHLILVTSVEEGWGLVVTEANSQGCPAVVYEVNGLKDSVRKDITGMVTDANPASLAKGVTALIRNKKKYDAMRKKAWQWSKQITFEKSYRDFMRILETA